jgi:hypothetical protein
MMLQTGPPLVIRAVQITKEKEGDRVPRFLAVTLERILVLAPVEADGADMDARTSVSSGLLSALARDAHRLLTLAAPLRSVPTTTFAASLPARALSNPTTIYPS